MVTPYYSRGQIRRLSFSFSAILLDGPIVDEAIIYASSGEFDSEMYQNQKSNQCYFPVKMHVDVGETLGLIYGADTTTTDVHNVVSTAKLLDGKEKGVFVYGGYFDVPKGGGNEGPDIALGSLLTGLGLGRN